MRKVRRADTFLGSAWRATAIYAILAVATTWPLVLHLTRSLPIDQGDSLLNCWILSWNADHLIAWFWGNAAAFQDYWSPPIFHPAPLALAYSEHLFAESLQIAPIYGLTHNVVLCYNLLVLSTYVLSALGMYLLARELTARRARGVDRRRVLRVCAAEAPAAFPPAGAVVAVDAVGALWAAPLLHDAARGPARLGRGGAGAAEPVVRLLPRVLRAGGRPVLPVRDRRPWTLEPMEDVGRARRGGGRGGACDVAVREAVPVAPRAGLPAAADLGSRAVLGGRALAADRQRRQPRVGMAAGVSARRRRALRRDRHAAARGRGPRCRRARTQRLVGAFARRATGPAAGDRARPGRVRRLRLGGAARRRDQRSELAHRRDPLPSRRRVESVGAGRGPGGSRARAVTSAPRHRARRPGIRARVLRGARDRRQRARARSGCLDCRPADGSAGAVRAVVLARARIRWPSCPGAVRDAGGPRACRAGGLWRARPDLARSHGPTSR